MFNLLSNAIKYNRAQGTITLEAEHTARGTVRLHIADTGLGIAREKQKDLFEPFNRLDAQSSEIQGTGIGLAITKRLMALMNGDKRKHWSTNGVRFGERADIYDMPERACDLIEETLSG